MTVPHRTEFQLSSSFLTVVTSPYFILHHILNNMKAKSSTKKIGPFLNPIFAYPARVNEPKSVVHMCETFFHQIVANLS